MQRRTIVIIVVALVANYFYRQFKNSEEKFDTDENYKYVADYLVNDQMENLKPILWVHCPSGLNARNWESFYSRSSTKLNMPYMYVTMKSIYDKCADSFNICLINDDSFSRLVPQWSVDLETMPSPVKDHYRQLGLTSLLFLYGGLLVPASTLCLKDLVYLYQDNMEEGAFVVEHYADGFSPNPLFMGCRRRSETMKAFMKFQSELFKNDKTNTADFKDLIGQWATRMRVVDGVNVGVKTAEGKPVLIQDLLGTTPVPFYQDALAIQIPEVVNRPKFSWFCRMSPEQILESNMVIANYILASY